MSGIDWSAIGADRFEDIVDILLDREFGDRGHGHHGRGGDGGRLITPLTMTRSSSSTNTFRKASRATGSRRRQITRSFRTAMIHDPDEWILVVPAKVTPSERQFVMGPWQ